MDKEKLTDTSFNLIIVDNDYIEGYVLNPFTQGLKLPKEVIKIVIKYVNDEQKEKAVS